MYDLISNLWMGMHVAVTPMNVMLCLIGALVGTAFIGAEALLLLGFDRELLPIRSALRRIGVLIRQLEEGPAGPERTQDARLPTNS